VEVQIQRAQQVQIQFLTLLHPLAVVVVVHHLTLVCLVVLVVVVDLIKLLVN
jgi:hypothetical protein